MLNGFRLLSIAGFLLFSFSGTTAAASRDSERLDTLNFDFVRALKPLVDQPTRFAAVLPKRINASKAGAWTTQDGLATWDYAVTVPEAVSLGFYADEAFLPEGSTVTVSGESSSATYDSTRFARGTLITGTFSGETLKVQVHVPAESSGTARFSIQRFHVGYRSLDGRGPAHPVYRKLLSQKQAKASAGPTATPKAGSDNTVCDLNYRCKLDEKPAIDEPGQSTVAITFSGVGYCTGNLISDVGSTYTPFITTAAHCIDYGNSSDIYDPDNFLFMWEQETPCGSELTPVDQTDPRAQTVGSVIRAMHQVGMLLEASSTPPIGTHPWFAGWDARDATNFTNPNTTAATRCDPSSADYDPSFPCKGMSGIAVWGIHQGRGYTKQYVESGTQRSDTTFATGRIYQLIRNGLEYSDSSGTDRTGPSIEIWQVSYYPETIVGRMTPGASGSALWIASTKRVIGSLVTARPLNRSFCEAGDKGAQEAYQRFASVFKGPASATAETAYKFWLDPANTDALLKDGSYQAARAGAATLSITPASSTAVPNTNLRIDYATTKAGFCQITGTGMVDRKVGYNGFITVNVGPAGTKTYTLSCVNDLQMAYSKSATVTVAAPTPPPVVTLGRSAGSITVGGTVTLTWSSTNSTNCTASGDWSGGKATSGNEALAPSGTGSKSYALSCTGAGGTDTESVSVTVNPASSSSGGCFGFLSALLLVPALVRRRQA